MGENEIRVLILRTLRDVLTGTGIVPKGMEEELVDYSELASNLASHLWQAEDAATIAKQRDQGGG